MSISDEQEIQKYFENFEQELKELKVPYDFIPDFSVQKIKQAWEVFQELLKERCLPPERRLQQYFFNSGWKDYYLHQTWFHPEVDQIYQPMPQQKQMNPQLNNPQPWPNINPYQMIPGHGPYEINHLQWIQRQKYRFNCFLESFNYFCYYSKLDHNDPKNLPLYQKHLRLCRKNNLHPDDISEIVKFKLKMNYLEEKNIIQEYTKESGMSAEDGITNITIIETSGFKVVIPVPGNMSFKDLFLKYAYKFDIPEDAIGNNIIFLYNAEKLDTKSTNPINTLFKDSNSEITVLDQANIIGT